MEKIKVLAVQIGKEPEVIEIENELEPMQKFVGGYIEMVYIEKDAALICNEEGIPMGLPFNRPVYEFDIYGPFFICGLDDEEEFASISEENAKKYTKLLSL